jgi:hypothetical protein
MDESEKKGTQRLDRVLRKDGEPKKVAKRKPNGQFPKGGHPDRQVGRKPGSKNRVTFLRLELEEALREQLRGDGLEILNKAISMAKNGNEKVIKVLLDKMLASPKGDDAAEAKDNDVRITIQNLTHGEQTTQVATIPRTKKEDDT